MIGMRRRPILGLVCLAGLTACAGPRTVSLGPQDAALLARVRLYLDDLRAVQARFVQVAPNGARSRGTVWMERPGRLRLTYDPPSQAVLVVDQGVVSLHDESTGATTTTPLWHTPLAMLLADRIVLDGPVTVTRFGTRPGAVVLTMVDTAHPAQGALTLTFSADPLTLHGLDLVDGRGAETRLVLSGLSTPTP